MFGDETYSQFLHHNHHYRQITAESREAVPAACINSSEFHSYFFEVVERTVADSKIDGVFLDEPHYYPLLAESEFTCVCEECQVEYERLYSEPMSFDYSKRIEKFREESMLRFLNDTCRAIKSASTSTEVAVCVLPIEGPTFVP
ncbi:MAG: hypothetical protein BAJATHORv1_70099 [Candidatus Thorarchaeota archaeon]|nr:MAG: hypothetical protein BAJATHORv1_70099 [Candidatus Thorarchaeota archaeon]